MSSLGVYYDLWKDRTLTEDRYGDTEHYDEAAVFISCPKCGGEGRLYTSRYGGNDPDVWDAGECPYCEGRAIVEEESEPLDVEDDDYFASFAEREPLRPFSRNA